MTDTLAFVIRVESVTGIQMFTKADPSGMYVAEYDPDGNSGFGDVRFVRDVCDAMHFDSMSEAAQLVNATSTVRPVRPDGLPNRPLTAYTVSVYGVSRALLEASRETKSLISFVGSN